MKTPGKILIIALIVAVIGYGTAYLIKQKQLLGDLDTDFTGAHIDNVSDGSATITGILKLTNDSDLAYTITKQSHDLYLNDNYVTTIKSSAPVDMPSRGSNDTELTFTVDKYLAGDAIAALLDKFIYKNAINLRINSTVDVMTGILYLPAMKFSTQFTI